jgi:uncharacterized protein
MQTAYYVFLHTPGPAWRKGKPISEQPLEGHFEYMSQLEAMGKLIVGGGFIDEDSGAMGVLRAANISEARQIVENDPAVTNGIVTTQVRPWFVTVAGTIEISGS